VQRVRRQQGGRQYNLESAVTIRLQMFWVYGQWWYENLWIWKKK